ncbi:MAG: DEAD/DEAH box helicase [Hormoscilla sp. SP12CHS1]|nr:DEAD/DEAH box helicase [Hormoscilla sp. SP12CHS1]
MEILHGSWLSQGELLIWGETWRFETAVKITQLDETYGHPLGMTSSELQSFWETIQQQYEISWVLEDVKWQTRAIALPTEIAKGTSDISLCAESPGTRAQQEISKSRAVRSRVRSREREEEGLFTVIPQHSAAPKSSAARRGEQVFLYPWEVEGLCLNTIAAMKFLQAKPLSGLDYSWLGSDLRFWSHLSRWSMDLLARGKFLPTLKGNIACWQPLLDSSIDQSRLVNFARAMPDICRSYMVNTKVFTTNMGNSISLPSAPQGLIKEFLSRAIDCQVRVVAGANSLPNIASPVWEWLSALNQENATIHRTGIESISTALDRWTAPVQHLLQGRQGFLTCFKLHPPASSACSCPEGRGMRKTPPSPKDWMLEYCLQAADDPEFLVEATTIWNNPVEGLVVRDRTIKQPQETFLSGLGLASRLFPPIEASLETPRPLFCRLSSVQAYEFIKSAAWRFQDRGLGVILPPSLVNREGLASRLGLSIRADRPKLKKTEKIGLQSLLNFKWELTIGQQRLSEAEFKELIAQGSPLVEINGEWVELRPQDVRAAEEFFASRKDKVNLSLEDALRIGTGDTQTNAARKIEKLPVVSFETSGVLQELLANLTDNRSIKAMATPANFRGELRPYQARGASWLAFLQRWSLGACLADDMGLGKTIELIAFLLHLQEQDALTGPTLLVCPTSVLGNWEREVRKFAPTLKTLVHHGEKRAKGQDFAWTIQDRDLIVTSYSLAFRDEKELSSVEWQAVVLDEAQNIKNPASKQSQAVRQLQTELRIALTGTPVENKLQELWSIMDFLNPGYLGTRQFFQRRFAMPIEKYGDPDSLQTLRSLAGPFILRRLKTDRDIIQDLPEKQEMTVFCGLTPIQAELYQQVVDRSLAQIDLSDELVRHGLIIALLTKLKQICNHPAQFRKQKTLTNPQQSSKLMRLESMLSEAIAEGYRALIFTQFAEWCKLLKPYLERQLGEEVLLLYGKTRKKQREETIDRFQQDPQGPKIMILSLKAGGVGLNLTRANHVFHFDRWWNPAVENQATDRAFRIGQTRNVQVHKFVCSGTLEEKIHEMIESKKLLAEQVVGTGEKWLAELDSDRLRDLLLLDRSAIIDEE